ncbi:MAG TPA: hypothetical protein DDX72_07405 [Ruminococcaceae bacterium]|nr:hypothetical protein [Oscillospiraceae bacterium]
MIIEICVGSSCHLKGSENIVNLFRDKIAENFLENDVVLAGCFCAGKCSRTGVTVKIDDEEFTGLTAETFNEFFKYNVMKKLVEK